MNLGDQLDELRKNILRDRSDLIAGDTDSLWSDETLIKYIEDAERRFARQTMLLRDSNTPEVTQIRLISGTKLYAAHPSLLAVISARYDTDDFDLQRSGHGLIAQYTPPEFLSVDPTMLYTVTPDRPTAYYTDETLMYARQGRITVSFYPPPGDNEAGKLIALRVIRLPITAYSLDDLDRESELPEDYHLDVLEWAAYRAQRGFDGDAGAPTVSNAHKDAFDDAVKKAIKETKAKMFANIGFRYGQNGFGGYVR